MRIDILTLFPNIFDNFINESIIKRAREKKLVDINIYNIRDYTKDKHKNVDDTPYGGGSGMVLQIEPIYLALKKLKKKNSLVILTTPQGIKYKQEQAYELCNQKHIIIICGHYEGFDERIRALVDIELSIGDYVLTGGEIPAMVITDSITRLIKGVIEEDSHLQDSFNNNLLDYPVYTKPADFKGMKVPEVLLSGHHENINKWRKEQQLKTTLEKRPDLLEKR